MVPVWVKVYTSNGLKLLATTASRITQCAEYRSFLQTENSTHQGFSKVPLFKNVRISRLFETLISKRYVKRENNFGLLKMITIDSKMVWRKKKKRNSFCHDSLVRQKDLEIERDRDREIDTKLFIFFKLFIMRAQLLLKRKRYLERANPPARCRIIYSPHAINRK